MSASGLHSDATREGCDHLGVHSGDENVDLGDVQASTLVPLGPGIEALTITGRNRGIREERSSPTTTTELVLCGLGESAGEE